MTTTDQVHDIFRNVFALYTVEMTDPDRATVEAVELLRVRDGETLSGQIERVALTIRIAVALGAAHVTAAATVSGKEPLDLLASSIARTELRWSLTALVEEAYAKVRTFPARSTNPEDYYCPLCRCNKSGDATDPNARTEACERRECACHDGIDAR